MTFEFGPSFGQTYRASLWVAFRNPFVWPALVFFPAGAIALLLLAISVRGWPSFFDSLIALAALGFVPGITAANVWLARRKNRSVLGTHRYTFTEDAITLSGPLFDTRLSWDAVFRARQSREFFFIYLSPQAAYFVPVQAVAITGELHAFRTLLVSKLAGKARLRPAPAA